MVKKFPLYLTPAEQIAVRIVEVFRKQHKALERLHASNIEYDRARTAWKKAQQEHKDAVEEWHRYETIHGDLSNQLVLARQEEKLQGYIRPIHVAEDILYPKENNG